MKFEYFEDSKGKRPFQEFLDSLSAKDSAKLLWVIRSIEQLGLETAKRQKWTKKIEDNLFEVRSIQGSDIQRGFYFNYDNGKYIITHGFSKKVDKTPKREIKRAKTIRADFMNKKAKEKR